MKTYVCGYVIQFMFNSETQHEEHIQVRTFTLTLQLSVVYYQLHQILYELGKHLELLYPKWLGVACLLINVCGYILCVWVHGNHTYERHCLTTVRLYMVGSQKVKAIKEVKLEVRSQMWAVRTYYKPEKPNMWKYFWPTGM